MAAQSTQWILKQTHSGKIFNIHESQDIEIGRQRQFKVSLLSTKVSRIHARMGLNKYGEIWLKDLKSGNGTFVDGRRIEDIELVHHGAKISFGLQSMDKVDVEKDRLVFYDLIKLDNTAASAANHVQVSADMQNGGIFEFANMREVVEISDDEASHRDIEENVDNLMTNEEVSRNTIAVNGSDEGSCKSQSSMSKDGLSSVGIEEIDESFEEITEVHRISNHGTEDRLIINDSNDIEVLPPKETSTLEPLLISSKKNIQNTQEEDEIPQISDKDIHDDQEEIIPFINDKESAAFKPVPDEKDDDQEENIPFINDKESAAFKPLPDDKDDYFEISDGEDLSCSQIFQMSILPESEYFQKIKTELAEMNFTENSEVSNQNAFDVDEDDQGFDNTQQLRELLENSVASNQSPFDMDEDDHGFENTQDLCDFLEDDVTAGTSNVESNLTHKPPPECSTNTNLEPASAPASPKAPLQRKSPRFKNREADSICRESYALRKNLESPLKKKLTILIPPLAIGSKSERKRKHSLVSNVRDLKKQLALTSSSSSGENVSKEPRKSDRLSMEVEKAKKQKLEKPKEKDVEEPKKKRRSSLEERTSKEPKRKHRRSSTKEDDKSKENNEEPERKHRRSSARVDDKSKEKNVELERKHRNSSAKEDDKSKEKNVELERKHRRSSSAKVDDKSKEIDVEPERKHRSSAKVDDKSKENIVEPERKHRRSSSKVDDKSNENNVEPDRKHRSSSAKVDDKSKEDNVEPERKHRRSSSAKVDDKSKEKNAEPERKHRRSSAKQDDKSKEKNEPKKRHRRSSTRGDKADKPEPEKQLHALASGSGLSKQKNIDPKKTHAQSTEVKKPQPGKLLMTLRSSSDLSNPKNRHFTESPTNRSDYSIPTPGPLQRLRSLDEISLENYKRRQNPRLAAPSTQNSTSSTESIRLNDNGYTRRAMANYKRCNVDETIMEILKWDTSWLKYQLETISFEPLLHSTPAKKIPLKFENFEQYYTIFNKLILLETWESMFKSYTDLKQSRASVTMAKVENTRIENNFMNLDCKYDINGSQLEKGEYCKPNDLIMVEYYGERNSLSRTNTMTFGLVQSSRSTVPNGRNPHSKNPQQSTVYFCVMVPYLSRQKIDNLRKVVIQRVASLRTQIMLMKAIKSFGNSQLCPMLLCPKINDFRVQVTHEKILVQPANLNTEQQNIVLEAASLCTGHKPGIYTLIGPPGTGKSETIVYLISQIILSHHFSNTKSEYPRILLVAPSNVAVDNLLGKITNLRKKLSFNLRRLVKCVRIGPEASIGLAGKNYSLQYLSEKHVPNIHQALPAIQHCRLRRENEIEFCKMYFGKDYNKQLRISENMVMEKSNVIVTTLGSCASNGKIIESIQQRRLNFTCCIIDEATQCHEPESLLPTLLGINKIVMVGDPQQLNATILSREGSKLGLGESLFSRVVNNFKTVRGSPLKMLTTQYRMHPEICSFPNRKYYGGKLQCRPNPENKLPDTIAPYLVFNCTNQFSEDDSDYTNTEEMRLIIKLVTTIIKMVNNQTVPYTVGIITPYNAQRILIHNNIEDIALRNPNWKISINTVDSFQGSENDIVIISCVRYSTNMFLQNVNRLNVALTRAKQALYIFGLASLFTECRPLYDLREDARDRRVCLDICSQSQNIKDFSKYLCRKSSRY